MSTVTRNIHISINGQDVVNSLTGIRGAIRNTERDIRNLNRNDKDYQETLRQHQQRLAALREEYTRARGELGQTPGVLQRIKGELGDVATGMLKAFTVTALIGTFVNGIKSAFNIVVEFDQAQANLAGILDTTKAGVSALTFEAIKLGAKLPFTSTEVSKAQLELAKLGKSIEEIINMTPGVLNAAIAMDTDLASAAEFVAGQLNSYAEGSAEATKYADIMSNSTNISATSFEYLSTSIPKVSKVASVANVTFEKLNATIGVLADQNIAAETAGTGFRNILLTASKEGVHYEQLLQKVKGSTDQLSTATELFGKENATVAVVLANSTEKIIAQTTALENSSGSAEKLAKEKMNSLQGDMKLFDSAMEGLVLSIEKGDGAIGQLTRGVIQFGTKMLELVTPTRKVSDELFDQQVELNKLISEITSSNVSNERRLELINKLKENYPELIDNIDFETISNKQLLDILKHVNDNYRERIRLQLEVEKADKIRERRDDVSTKTIKLEERIIDKLAKTKSTYGLTVDIDTGDLEGSAKKVMTELKKIGKDKSLIGKIWDQFDTSDYGEIEALVNQRKYGLSVEKEINEELQKQSDKISQTAKDSGIITEDKRKANAAEANELQQKIEQAKKLGGKEGKDFKADDIDSIKEYIKAKQLELEIESQSANRKKELSEKEIKQREKAAERKNQIAEREKEREEEIYNNAEKEIDKILLTSLHNREIATHTGINRDIRAIQNKYAQELIKFKDHKDRLKELEVARDAEIAEVKRLKNQEYMLQQFEIEKQLEDDKEIWRLEKVAQNANSEEERQLLLIDKAKYIADLEIQNELDKELAKVENVEMAEELKEAIRDKYRLKKEQSDDNFNNSKKALLQKEVDWTKISEQEKQNIARNSLNMASEAFNEGSGAWKAAKIAETSISTYQSATNAYNSLSGIPIVGPALGAVAAGLAVVTGLKNVQKIASTKIPQMPSYYYGGHTGSAVQRLGGDKYGEFTGMTHANEWVMPAIMTQSPRYADTLTWLENERKYGATSNPPGGDNDALIQASVLLASVTTQLNDTLKGGIKSNLLLGYDDLKKMNRMNEEITQSKNNANL
ncbi:phage tail tape measure protein [Myroides marinus]|uniref:phage tail tape measure protein n=1 Tax=Myroides marinus TaxID=703342 RepID=UPI0025791CC9|nr:phage tail tape measure protein [Myroides marinus]MDM1502251.1 phage tail tape measure protein [Myroides marinus]